MGVGLAADTSGAARVLSGTSEPHGYLRPGVLLKEGETLALGLGHAEADIVNFFTQQHGLRLDSISTVLAESFRHATPANRRKAVLVACTLVVSRVGLEGEEVVAALESLRHGGAVDLALRLKLEVLTARLDEEYLRLDEEGDETNKPEALRLFSRARAASSLVFALSAASEQFHEAIYEALAAVNNAIEVSLPVLDALQKAPPGDFS